MMKNILLSPWNHVVTIGVAAFLLAACGDDVTQINQNGLEVYSAEKDLPKCSEDNDGDQAWIKGEPSVRICSDGEWFALSSGENSNGDFSCKTEELRDGSGLKIVCNGDSIGVVYNGAQGEAGKNGENGKDGADGEDGKAGSGCSISGKTDSTVTVKCGDSTMVLEIGNETGLSVLEPDSERTPISLDSLAGFTQKGPFLKGSSVYLYELSDGRTLKQTNGNFTSIITRDDGRYKFTARDLVSQYAMVVVEGYYRNEVTGAVSDAPIRLRTLTDLRKHQDANVNLLTHLEYDRVYYLVTRGDSTGKKLTVKQAKRQAQKEILKQFHIELDENTDAEDMNVFGSSEADAALLAVSILLQGEGNSTNLSVLATEISNAITETGKWEGENAAAVKAGIADWLLDMDMQGKLANYRNNVNGWGLSTTVPYFEKFIRKFAGIENGLGVCGDKNNPVGTVKNVTNKNSKTYYAASYTDATNKTRFICADADSAKWRVAENIEKDTLGWGTGAFDGEVQNGQINTSIYYIYETSKNAWRYATTLEKDTYQKTCSEDGTLFSGNVTDTVYVCDNGKFRMANSTEISYGKGCTSHNSGELYIPHKQYSYYKCGAKGWEYDFDNLNEGTVEYGGKTYRTIGIKTQNWMAENLNYEVEGQSYCYNNSADSCAKYGRLYTWAAAVGKTEEECGKEKTCGLTGTVRGICPEGWHLPSSSEWNTLYSAMGSSRYAMQAKGVANWPDATDAYGFSALPVGYYENGYFPEVGKRAYFWSATEVNIYYANNWTLGADFTSLSGGFHKIYGCSIRCVMD